MKGDVATLSWIEDRLTFGVADARSIDDQLRYLAAATEAKEFKAVAAGAARLQAAFPAA
jgi:hypothetical protein